EVTGEPSDRRDFVHRVGESLGRLPLAVLPHWLSVLISARRAQTASLGCVPRTQPPLGWTQPPRTSAPDPVQSHITFCSKRPRCSLKRSCSPHAARERISATTWSTAQERPPGMRPW